MTTRRQVEAAPPDPDAPAPGNAGVTLWRVEVSPRPVASRAHDEVCRLHDWTCIWCSMDPPICGSCRPLTPPCPANGGIHHCACQARAHDAQEATAG